MFYCNVTFKEKLAKIILPTMSVAGGIVEFFKKTYFNVVGISF